MALGTSNFTFECWVYFLGTPGVRQYLFSVGNFSVYWQGYLAVTLNGTP